MNVRLLFQINRKTVNAIWFLFSIIRFEKYFFACILAGRSRVDCVYIRPGQYKCLAAKWGGGREQRAARPVAELVAWLLSHALLLCQKLCVLYAVQSIRRCWMMNQRFWIQFWMFAESNLTVSLVGSVTGLTRIATSQTLRRFDSLCRTAIQYTPQQLVC